jgi:hypothetical protein
VIVVLGGYGSVGAPLCERLASGRAAVTIAGRSAARASEHAARIRAKDASAEVTAASADARDAASVRALLRGARMLVVAAPVRSAAARLAAACLDAGCDYLDIVPSPVVDPAMNALDERARRSGRLVVTQAGLCPGLPSALVRAAGRRLDRCRAARVGIALSMRHCTQPEEAYEIVDAAVDYGPRVYERGAWRMASRARARVRMDYGPGFGERTGLPLDLPELHGVEEELGLGELAAFAATPSWRIDAIGRAALGALYRVRRGLGRRQAAALLLAMSRRAPASAGASVVAAVDGERGGRACRSQVGVGHGAAAPLTAMVVAAFLRRYLAEAFRNQAGVRAMGHLFDDEALQDLPRMGARLHLS